MPGGFGALLQNSAVLTTAKFSDHIGGYFFPQNTSAPTVPKLPSGYDSVVTRTGVGLYLVKVLQTAGFIKPLLAATQNPTPLNIQLTVCVDPAGAVQPISAQVVGGITFKANSFSFGVGTFRTDTPAAYDIIQPGTPTLNGSFVMWRVIYSELNYTRWGKGGA
jgi:hypothetical protein